MISAPESALILVGWDFRKTPLALRERMAFSPERTREALARLTEGGLLSESVIVSTCNRSEIYGVAVPDAVEDPAEALTRFIAEFHQLPRPEITDSRYLGSGASAVNHLFRVAAGLESLALGEDQILKQVRDAFRLASGAGATRAVLHRMFQKAFEAGKRVRSETGLSSRPTSIPGVAMELAQKIYEDIDRRAFLIVGAGETAAIFHDLLIARSARRIEVINRTAERAERLCRRGGTPRRWDELESRLPAADVVVCATSSPEPIIRSPAARQALSLRRGEPMFFLDLSVPRNIEESVASIDNAFLYGVDDLELIARKNRREREVEIPVAERILEEEVGDFLSWLGSLAVIPTLTALRERFERVRERDFDAPLSRLDRVPDSEKEKIRRLAHAMVHALLRRPTDALKEEDDPARRIERAEAVRHLFGLDEKSDE